MAGNGLETVKSELDAGETRGCVSWLLERAEGGAGDWLLAGPQNWTSCRRELFACVCPYVRGS